MDGLRRIGRWAVRAREIVEPYGDEQPQIVRLQSNVQSVKCRADSELEERLKSCQQQVSSAERKASRSLKRAEAEAQDVLRKAAARRVVGALRRYEDGASLKSVRDVFVYWRRGTHAVTSQSMEAKHAAACDSLRKDLEAAHQRHAAARDELLLARGERDRVP